METEFSYQTRAGNVARLATEPADVLVVGAGIFGAAIARDAAMRGLKTAIVDKGDFGSGSSSRTSRLVLGGSPDFERHGVRLAMTTARECRTMQRIAPHLLWRLPVTLPLHRDKPIPTLRLLASLWLYDALATRSNAISRRWLRGRAVRATEPQLREKSLQGGIGYWDWMCDDARLVLATIRSAHDHSAVAANYLRVDRLDVADHRIRGAHITDLVSGKQFVTRALTVVDATGPWSGRTLALAGAGSTPRLRKETHIVVSRAKLGTAGAITFASPLDRRLIHIVPCGEEAYIGTASAEWEGTPEECYAGAADIVYLLRSVNALLPAARLSSSDVLATWTSVRAIPEGCDPGQQGHIWEGPDGLLHVVGGRFSAHCRLAGSVLDRIAAQLGRHYQRPIAPRADTEHEPLPGGAVHDLAVLAEDAVRDGFTPVEAEHLVRAFGSETAAVTRLAMARPALARPVLPGHPEMLAELVHSMRREMAITLSDLLMRRTRLFYADTAGLAEHIEEIADLARGELGWDTDRTAAELAAFKAAVSCHRAFLEEVADCGR